MTHLEHVSAAGIRFDTEVQYLTKRAPGLRYERLPIRKSTSAVDLHANQRAAMHLHPRTTPARAAPREGASGGARYAKPGYPLSCRHLTGEAYAARLS